MKQPTTTWKIILILACIGIAIGGTYWYEISQEEEENTDASLYQLPDSLFSKPLNQEDSAFLRYPTESEPVSSAMASMTVQNPNLPFKAAIQVHQDSISISIHEEGKKVGTSTQHHLTLKKNQELLSAQLADLNRNDLPELYLFMQEKKGMTLVAYELRGKKLVTFQLPPLMGRQTFGYAAQDSIYLYEEKIVRRFRFENAQFTEFPSGNRYCEYMLDPTLHFTLVKAIDSER